MQTSGDKKQAGAGVGVYTHVAQWAVYSVAWSVRRDKKTRLAVGSFLEDYNNKVELIQFNPDAGNFTSPGHQRLILDHPYTPSNLMFYPSEDTSCPDLLATSGDFLRLWEVVDAGQTLRLKTTLLNGNGSSEFSSPVTSFDWSEFEPHRVATSSVDTTCAVWDVHREALDTQLVAHDKEVYDVSWGGPGVFASVSADGSVRVFDLRNKERSTIIYECPAGRPLLRAEWNKADPKLIAAVGMDSDRVVVLDIRFPTAPLVELGGHKACVNAVSWAPRTGAHLCSVSDDSRALVWDVVGLGLRPGPGEGDVDPIMWYGSPAELNNVRWSQVEPEWIAVTFLNKMQLLKV